MMRKLLFAATVGALAFGSVGASADHTENPGYEPSKVCKNGPQGRVATGTDPHSVQSASVCLIDNQSPIKGAATVGVVDTNRDGTPDGAYFVVDGDSTNDEYVIVDSGGHIGVSTYTGQEVFCDFGDYEYGESRFCGFQ